MHFTLGLFTHVFYTKALHTFLHQAFQSTWFPLKLFMYFTLQVFSHAFSTRGLYVVSTNLIHVYYTNGFHVFLHQQQCVFFTGQKVGNNLNKASIYTLLLSKSHPPQWTETTKSSKMTIFKAKIARKPLLRAQVTVKTASTNFLKFLSLTLRPSGL